MPRGKKIAAALILLGLGFGTAMLFRRTDSPEAVAPAADPQPQKEALVLRESAADALHPTNGSQLGPVPLKPSQTTEPPQDLTEPITLPDKPIAPPELPLRFDRSLSSTGEPMREVEQDLAMSDRYTSPLSTVPQGTPPLRVHKVVDGDTLGRLAQRFLGDANRHREIHALNRAKLPDPNVLPIGVELKIPPRDGTLTLKPTTTPEDENALSSATSGLESSTPLFGTGSDSGLVPVTAGKPHLP